MSTYKPEYIAGLINSQLSLIVEKVERGIITDSQAIHTMALVQDGVSEALANIRTHFESITPTVKVEEYCVTKDHPYGTGPLKVFHNFDETYYECVWCNGKGRVWHEGCGDTDESCIECDGTGYTQRA